MENRIETLRQRGNKLLEEDDAKGAALAYREAISLAEEEAKKNDKEIKKLWVANLLNLAAAELRMNEFILAEKSATEAMEICDDETPNVKALYRRAVARRHLSDFEGAYEDLQMAMRLDPREALFRQEFSALKQAYLASEQEENDDEVVDRLEAMGKSSELTEAIAKAAFEPFYLIGDSTENTCDEQLKNEIANIAIQGVTIHSFGSCVSVATKENSKVTLNSTVINLKYVDVYITPNTNSPYFGVSPLEFRLVFGPEWPKFPPKIRAVSLLAHSNFNGPRRSHNAHHARRATPEFYEALLMNTQNEDTSFTLHQILIEIKKALNAPPVKERSTSWMRYARQHAHRQAIIKKYVTEYKHVFPQLFTPPGAQLDAIVLDMITPAIRTALKNNNPHSACYPVADGIWTFDLFSPQTSKLILDEVDHFYGTGLPSQRVNSMNRYGVILSDIGLEPFITTLQRLVCKPIAQALFKPNATTGDQGHPAADFDSHHAFIVKYRKDQDSHLDIHTGKIFIVVKRKKAINIADDSDVTFNISLGRAGYVGSNLIFCGMIGSKDHRQHFVSYEHAIGRCVVHLGSRRHGTDNIISGERVNLIIWNHSLCWRESPAASHHQRNYEQEEQPPDPRCVSYTHDRDFGVFKEYPSVEREAEFLGRGWCPPPGAEYPGFKVE